MYKTEQRFDVFLSKILDIPREQINKLIKSNVFLINKKHAKPSTKIAYNDILEFNNIQIPNDENIALNIQALKQSIAQNIKPQKEIIFYDIDDENLVDVVYEDDEFLVVNKPTKLSTHGASSLNEPSLVDWLLKYKPRLSDVLGKERSGIIHRLDKCTSGALLVAKNNKTHLKLSENFKNQDINRIYIALIDNQIKDEKIVVEKYIMRNEKNRLKKIALNNPYKTAKYSKTIFANLYKFDDNTTLICAKLYTGKTHQIRAHLESLNRHILGDELYGSKAKVERVMLHAFIIGVKHPVCDEYMEFIAPIDDEFKAEIKKHHKGDISEKDIFDRVKLVLGDDF